MLIGIALLIICLLVTMLRGRPGKIAVSSITLHWRSTVAAYLIRAGKLMLSRGELSQAESYFRKALAVGGDSVGALEGLLSVKLQEGDFAGVSQTAKHLARIAPDHPQVMAMKAYQLACEGKVEDSISAYRQAGRLNQWDKDILLMNLQKLARQKKFAQAEQLAYQATDLFPAESLFLNNLAWWYQENNVRLDAALELTRQALKIDPGAAHVWDTLAWVHFRRGEETDALRAAHKALALRSVAESRVLLIILYLREGKTAEAERYLQPLGLLCTTEPSVFSQLRREVLRVFPRLTAQQQKKFRVLLKPSLRTKGASGPPAYAGNRASTSPAVP